MFGGLHLKRLYRFVNSSRKWLLVSVSAFTIVLCLLQVILRYFTFLSVRPFSWGDEMIRLSSLWVVFVGISIGVRENSHFSVTFFIDKIRNPKHKRIVQLLLDVITMLVLALLAYLGFNYAFSNTTSVLQNVDISMAWFYVSIPAGCLFCIFEFVYKFIYGPGYKNMMLVQKGGE